MALPPREFSVGQLAARSGVAVSALHFYEREGLISSRRTVGNQRRYSRDTLRRVAFIRVSHRVGIPLANIRVALDTLPDGRTPTKKDWARLSRSWHADLTTRIDELTRLRDHLTDCIGCGCLSMSTCALTNPDDRLAVDGAGPQRVFARFPPSDAVTPPASGSEISSGGGAPTPRGRVARAGAAGT